MTVRRIVPDLHGEQPIESRVFYEDVIGMSSDATAPVTPDVSIEVEDVDAVHRKAVECDPNGAVINVLQHS